MGQIREYYRPSLLLKKIELYSFPEFAGIDGQGFHFLCMKRYAYEWICPTVTTKVAVALLILHAIVILVHCCVLDYTGISYSFAGSIGALMLNSKPPVILESPSAEVSNGSKWARSTAVRAVYGDGNQADRFWDCYRRGSWHQRWRGVARSETCHRGLRVWKGYGMSCTRNNCSWYRIFRSNRNCCHRSGLCNQASIFQSSNFHAWWTDLRK